MTNFQRARIIRYFHLPAVIFLFCAVMLPCISAQDDYKVYLQQQQTAYNDFQKAEQAELEAYIEQVRSKWNKFRASTRPIWNDYSHDLNTLSSVDFENGTITVETIIPRDSANALDVAQRNITRQVRRLLSSDTTTRSFVLDRQLVLKSGDTVDSTNADSFIEEQVIPSLEIAEETVESEDGVERVRFTTVFNLVPDHLKIRAHKYLPLVRANCKRFQLDVPLVMAVMQTESYFNPRAKSPAPAYGLMQLVPSSGGRDAYRYAYSEDRIVRPAYLYVPENNVELGCAYLAKLRDTEFRKVNQADKMRYCIVASYNTGPSNTSKAIVDTRDIEKAVTRINRMDAAELLELLVNNLPYAETREYLQKVESRLGNYIEWQ